MNIKIQSTMMNIKKKFKINIKGNQNNFNYIKL